MKTVEKFAHIVINLTMHIMQFFSPRTEIRCQLTTLWFINSIDFFVVVVNFVFSFTARSLERSSICLKYSLCLT